MPIRKKIKVTCEVCGKEYETRLDHYRNRYIKQGKYPKCRMCACVKNFGHIHSTGYMIRHYKSFPIAYWDMLKIMSKDNGQLKEHRAIMAIHLNRPLLDTETVHHINGDRSDNRVENLELMNGFHCMGQRESDIIIQNKNLVEENIRLKGIILCLLNV